MEGPESWGIGYDLTDSVPVVDPNFCSQFEKKTCLLQFLCRPTGFLKDFRGEGLGLRV